MKSFSELTSASQVDNADLVAISQTSGNGYASKKTTVKDIADKSNLNLADEYDSTSTYAVDDYVIYDSVLYKCIGTTTGTFDLTKWTSVVVTDEMGSGGGGGTGGHTIIDEDGNTMTARSGLQFAGAVEVTDDSVNNKTIVDVLGGDFYNPVIYSLQEREIGVWTDGKPLYQKTFEFDVNDLQTETYGRYIEFSIDDIDKICLSTITLEDGMVLLPFYTSGTNFITAFPAISTDVCKFSFRYGNDVASQLSAYFVDCKAILYYTKTTDVAGSGSWTPQGVPTHHYSTDEQVIGTWIDGSTIYEKTIHTGALSTGANSIAHNISNIGSLINAFGKYVYSTYEGTFPFVSIGQNSWNVSFAGCDTTNVVVEVGASYTGNNAITDSYTTIQYTKSS